MADTPSRDDDGRRRRFYFQPQITLGNALNCVAIIVGVTVYLVETRGAADRLADRLAERYTRAAEDIAAVKADTKWIADKVWTIDNRVVGVEAVQKSQAENIRRLNNAFGVPVTPPPRRNP